LADENRYIAVDLGAESGRVMLGLISADKLHIEEIHRFPNGPIEQDGSLRWDFPRLLSEVKNGIAKAVTQAHGDIAGIGIDSWGVDFGLLDENGRLIENPCHYRDSRTSGIMDKAFNLMPKRQIYEHTGIQFLQFNTIYQLLAMRLSNSPALKKAKKLLLIADLVSYMLSGRAYAEFTLAGTTQLMDMRTGSWSREIFKKLNLPIEIMPRVVPPGTVVGSLTQNIAAEIGCDRIPVIAAGSHDTACAVAAVPADYNTKWAYISSGTWSLIGIQSPTPVINDKTFEFEFTNEGAVDGSIRLLKNIMGLWLVQQCKTQWAEQGQDFSYDRLTEMANKAAPFAATVNVNDTAFLTPGDMPKRINEQLERTGQPQISDKGQLTRVLLESLALTYRRFTEQLEGVTAAEIECLHIVGGGSKNTLLNQFTASATGKKVIAGPVEATAVGNLLAQAHATGRIKTAAQAGKLLKNSFELTEYEPVNSQAWQTQFRKAKKQI